MTAGPRLGHRLADIIVRRHFDAKRRYSPELVKLAMEIQHQFFTLTGDEHKATTGGLWKQLLDTGEMQGWTKDTADFLANGSGQWQTLLSGQATGAAMGAGIMAVLQNELAPVVQAILKASPNAVLAPGDAAQAVARGLGTLGWGRDQAARGGLPNDLFDNMVITSLQQFAPSELATLLNRGKITVPELQRLLKRGGFDPDLWAHVIELGQTRIEPGDLASLVTFGVLPEAHAADMAGDAGMNADDFHLLVEGNGQPPSTEDLLFAYRRKIIDKARLLKGITQGPTRTEWFDVIESLGSIPMSTSDAIEAAVQGHLSQGAAQTIAEQNGLEPSAFAPLFATAGSPPGPEAMMNYLNRGFIDQAGAVQALTESRLKPKYTDLILKSRVALLPMVQVREALGHGSITHAHAVEVLGWHGYATEDIDVILQSGAVVKTKTARQLTESQVLSLHTERAITDQQATEMLAALDYTPDEIGWLLDLTNLQHMTAMVNAAIAKVRASYVARHLAENDARTDLDALGVLPDQQDSLVTLWDIERSTVTKTLTLAQCGAAYKKGFITADAYTQRVLALGYAQADVDILIQLAAPAATAG